MYLLWDYNCFICDLLSPGDFYWWAHSRAPTHLQQWPHLPLHSRQGLESCHECNLSLSQHTEHAQHMHKEGISAQCGHPLYLHHLFVPPPLSSFTVVALLCCLLGASARWHCVSQVCHQKPEENKMGLSWWVLVSATTASHTCRPKWVESTVELHPVFCPLYRGWRLVRFSSSSVSNKHSWYRASYNYTVCVIIMVKHAC